MTISTETTNPVLASESGCAGRLMVDAPIRMFHALFAMCFFGAWLTAECERWRGLHVTLGYSMAGLLLFRIAYGLFGPPQARLHLLFGRFKGLLSMTGLAGSSDRQPDENASRVSLPGTLQNASMAATILALVVLMVSTGITGYLAWNDAPEWVAELHEASGEAFINLGFVHIALVLCFSLLRKRNLALTMMTGKIAGPGPDLVQHNRIWLALVMFIAVCAFATYELQQMSAGIFTDRGSAWTFKKGGKHKHAIWKGKHERAYPGRKHEREEND